MAIDYILNYPCTPKQALSLNLIVELLKNQARAEEVINLYRSHGDHRPVTEIGFELSRRVADGTQETKLVIAGDLLEDAKLLNHYAHHCEGCPANFLTKPYGCIGKINYPLSNRGEIWLLEQLPDIADPILFLMLIRGIQEIGYTGQSARQLRDQVGTFFQNPDTLARRYAEMDVTTDILFEMTFQLGPIQPPHGAMLLLFYHVIPRSSIDPPEIMALTRQEISPEQFLEKYPFLHQIQSQDERTTRELKQFLKAVYLAYTLNTALLLDI